ncbi:hypothetical protein RND71_016339 [Anisodus tanguticus]|uniref:N-acetyltransferase domain-containing protein n=1 Tax=Anisodus tanguticus TaxID=243964 RepID=A0AAE1S800_9SOLA|nr:hypothetical protein RND71_016339 [Anisodus tanguticus]
MQLLPYQEKDVRDGSVFGKASSFPVLRVSQMFFFSPAAYYNDICVGSVACRLEKKEGESVCVYIMTLSVLAPYRVLEYQRDLLAFTDKYEDAINFYKKFGFEPRGKADGYQEILFHHEALLLIMVPPALTHVYSEQNKLADQLTLFDSTLDRSDIIHFQEPPPFVIDLLQADQGGTTTPRRISEAKWLQHTGKSSFAQSSAGISSGTSSFCNSNTRIAANNNHMYSSGDTVTPSVHNV